MADAELATADRSADKLTATVKDGRVYFVYRNVHGTMGSWNVSAEEATKFAQAICRATGSVYVSFEEFFK